MPPPPPTNALFQGVVEFADRFRPRPHLAHVLFDFDGTLSLLREGWPEVMVPMFAEMLPRQATETEAEVQQLLLDDIMRLNGKQTIYQMMQFADRVRERGGQPQEPLWYKHEYLRRLNERIAGRLAALRDGASPERYLVHGARHVLELLQARGVALYLASGTDEVYVRQEAALLGIAPFFGRHIYGALDDYRQFSKKLVIDRILAENRVSGEQLLAFGDGYVEIENTKEVGGLAVAVASDEANNGSGRIDPWKRQRLCAVGADAVVPDYRDADALLACLFGESPVPTAQSS
jgi:phosphoglycolate phosphatase-like HAD superfamily hydrolase